MAGPDVKSATEEWQRLITNAEELLGTFAGRTDAAAEQLRSRVEGTVRNARERLATLEGDAREFTNEAVDTADEYVHNNPWRAVAIAAAAGVILGALLTRRTQE